MIDLLLENAGGIAQTVAVEVVPPVINAVDIDAILDRIDLDALLARVDVNALVERIDLDAVLERTEFGAVVSRSAGAVAGRTLDVVRGQVVGLDTFVERWTARLLRRDRPR